MEWFTKSTVRFDSRFRGHGVRFGICLLLHQNPIKINDINEKIPPKIMDCNYFKWSVETLDHFRMFCCFEFNHLAHALYHLQGTQSGATGATVEAVGFALCRRSGAQRGGAERWWSMWDFGGWHHLLLWSVNASPMRKRSSAWTERNTRESNRDSRTERFGRFS